MSAEADSTGEVVSPPPSGSSAAGSGLSVAWEATAVARAQSFLSSLDDAKGAEAVLLFDAPERVNWSNLPAGMVSFAHNGVRMGDLEGEQTEAMRRFLIAALSADGFDTVMGVLGAERVLAESAQAGRMLWDPEAYWVAFFGEPTEGERWGWQFGGHHLAVNVTVVDGRSYMSPTFIGVEPASYYSDGVREAPMAAEAEAGLELINALGDAGRDAATIERRPRETLTGAGRDGVIPPLEGARVAEWDTAQQELLLDAISLWVGMMPEEGARIRMEELRAELGDVRFAWHGDIDGSGPIYYRIQGPSLIIEFSTQGDVGSDAGHYHSVYRDPTNEYGVDP